MCINQLIRFGLENNPLFPVLIDTQMITLQEQGSVLWVNTMSESLLYATKYLSSI